jgi:hypothetical protein
MSRNSQRTHCALFAVCLLSSRLVVAAEAPGSDAPKASGAGALDPIAAAKALEETKAATAPDEVYAVFNRFCRASFGANAEPLVRETFGKELKLVETGAWSHLSTRSAAMGFETNLPAMAFVEYGETAAYGQKTPELERPFYIHLHHLRDLKPETAYHYRLVCMGEDGGKLVSDDRTFKTASLAGAIELPGEVAGPPYILDKAGATYVLTKDITADATAFEIKADGVTLDLGGRTVVYTEKPVPEGTFTDKWMSYFHKGSFGVKVAGVSKCRLLNGSIRQGAAGERGNDDSEGFNPLYIRECGEVELAGIEVDYHSPQVVGVNIRYAHDKCEVHHCRIRDRGTKMHNRHAVGCVAVNFLAPRGTGYRMHHNLVARTRQNGLRGPLDELASNEIYVDSWATNSFACSGGDVHHNRIFGTGYHVIAVPWGNGIKVHDNFVHMQGINTGQTRWWEGFGDQNSMNGLRHTQWGDNKTPSENSEYANNIVCIYGRNGSQIRGVEFFSDTYIKGLTLRDSIVKVISQDEATAKAACVATHGNPKREETQNPVFYRNCTFVSNVNLVRFGDDYGQGSHHQFAGCRLVRAGEDARFHTFAAMGAYWSRYHRFIDCVFEKGASPEDVDWGKTAPGTRDYTVEWTLAVTAAPDAEVSITDAKGAKVFSGKTGADGKVEVPLAQYRMSHSGKEALTPHAVTVGGKAEKVTMDSRKEIVSK